MLFFKAKAAGASATADSTGFKNLEGLLSQQFSNLFNSYAKAFNKQQSRKGNLFMHTFKRKLISDENYFKRLVCYIHLNPVHAKMCRKADEYKYSSYRSIISEKPGFLEPNEVIDYFGDHNNFIYCHFNNSTL